MNGLIQSRLSQVDCQMQGFVLDGYPKTPGQVAALKDSYIQPTLIVMLEEGADQTQVSKEINEKYQNVVIKVGSGLSEEIFEKVCFHL